MYLNLVQVAESLGVSERVVEGWIRHEGMPHTIDRGRLLFERARVAEWAATRGLAPQAGFLAAQAGGVSAGVRLAPLLRVGGIWRAVAADDVAGLWGRVVEKLPGVTPQVRALLAGRLAARGGVNLAPVGDGFALPHPANRIALGRDAGLLALVLLREPLAGAEPAPDGAPVTSLLFFIAPTPRAHLDLLARLGRLLARGGLREMVGRGASDDEILAVVERFDAEGAS